MKVDQSLAHRLALMSEERKNQLVLERLVRTNPSLYQRLLQEAVEQLSSEDLREQAGESDVYRPLVRRNAASLAAQRPRLCILQYMLSPLAWPQACSLTGPMGHERGESVAQN